MIRLLHGDCRDVMAQLAADSLDACVIDPPYHLIPGGLSLNNMAHKVGQPNRIANPSGFMGAAWDGGDVAFQPDTWRGVWRVLKPGAHMLCFGGTRTFHRMACAIEDAGFEIRDTLCWLYGSGFPKSLDVSKAIDKAAGAEREVVGKSDRHNSYRCGSGNTVAYQIGVPDISAPATSEAAAWAGWGTALKPAFEPIILARKPLTGTVAQNVLKHGTGAINVDACRIGTTRNVPASHSRNNGIIGAIGRTKRLDSELDPNIGRWPANVLHDGSDEVEAAFAAFGERVLGNPNGITGGAGYTFLKGEASDSKPHGEQYHDTGTASRFFYCAKADRADRADSRHPTVKPVALMRWLVRLITPPGGTVLDPFAGSGTTGEAAMLEGFDALLIEQDAQHVADVRHRINRWQGGDLPMFASAAD